MGCEKKNKMNKEQEKIQIELDKFSESVKLLEQEIRHTRNVSFFVGIVTGFIVTLIATGTFWKLIQIITK